MFSDLMQKVWNILPGFPHNWQRRKVSYFDVTIKGNDLIHSHSDVLLLNVAASRFNESTFVIRLNKLIKNF